MPNNRNRNRNNRKNNNNNKKNNSKSNGNNNSNSNNNSNQQAKAAKDKQQPQQQQQQQTQQQQVKEAEEQQPQSSGAERQDETLNAAEGAAPTVKVTKADDTVNSNEPESDNNAGNNAATTAAEQSVGETAPPAVTLESDCAREAAAASSMGHGNSKAKQQQHTEGAASAITNSNSNDTGNSNDEKPAAAKVIVHRIIREDEGSDEKAQPSVQPPAKNTAQQQQSFSQAKVIIHRILVEEPTSSDESTAPLLSPPGRRGVQIQEVDDMLSISDSNENPPLISEAESEAETDVSLCSPTREWSGYGNGDGKLTQIVNVQTLPLLGSPTSSLSPVTPPAPCTSPTGTEREAQQQEEELHRQRRAQKRVALEAHFLPQLLSPRYLDSISEENSDVSDALSDCSDQMAVNRHQDGAGVPARAKKANAVFPRSQLDFSRSHKHGPPPLPLRVGPTVAHAIAEEPSAVLVEEKYIAPTSSCATLDSQMTPEAQDAELVYIQNSSSASSSTSDLMESLNGEEENARAAYDLDTDASEIIAKPATNDGAGERESAPRSDERECTPVNQPSPTPSPASTHSTSTDNDSIATTIASPPPQQQMPELNNGDCALPHQMSERLPSPSATSARGDNEDEQSKALSSSGSVRSYDADDGGDRVAAERRLASMQSFVATTKTSTSSSSRTRTARTEFFTSAVERTVSSSSRADQTVRKSSPPPPSQSASSPINDMNNVREILNANSANSVTSETSSSHIALDAAFKRDSPSPPPVPPPRTQRTVPATAAQPPVPPTRHAQAKTTAPIPDTTSANYLVPTNATLKSAALLRQESADSHCSDSTNHSQCTAINVGGVDGATSPHSDTEMPILFSSSNQSCSLSDAASADASAEWSASSCHGVEGDSAIKKLRLLCAETLASMPYGEDVLEELATVAENIGATSQQQIQTAGSDVKDCQSAAEMPYPLPRLPHIGELQLSLTQSTESSESHKLKLTSARPSSPLPPPVPAPPASIANGEAWLGVPTDANPKLLVCLSPAQATYAREQPAATSQPDQLLDAHQKFVERRGYHEYSAEQVRAINGSQTVEQQMLETASVMRKLRKSLTPTPPPLPPPPVPAKSVETATKAQLQQQQQQKQQQQQQQNSQNDGPVPQQHANVNVKSDYDTSFAYANEHSQTQQQQQQQSTQKQPLLVNADGEAEQNEQNRLLAIIHGAADGIRQTLAGQGVPPASQIRTCEQTKTKIAKTSSHENNSRRSDNNSDGNGQPAAQVLGGHQQQQSVRTHERASEFVAAPPPSPPTPPRPPTPPLIANKTTTTTKTNPTSETEENMQSIETELGRMFPLMGERDIFERDRKRFSNIESTRGLPWTQTAAEADEPPRRYSSVETSSYASKKRVENGQVVYDVSSTKRDAQEYPATQAAPKSAASESDLATHAAGSQRPLESNGIMSAFKLNANESQQHSAAPTIGERTATTEIIKNSQQKSHHHLLENNSSSGSSANASNSRDAASTSYEEFRQRAKAAATAAASAPILPSAGGSAANASAFHFDQDKLFKDFDDLSRQLNVELDAGRARRQAQQDRSASLFDLSRPMAPSASDFRSKFEDFKKQRHEHMTELEQEIERSMRSRQLRMGGSPAYFPQQQQQPAEPGRTFQIPIRLEGDPGPATAPADYDGGQPRTYEIPIRIESNQGPATAPLDYNGNQPRTYEIPMQIESHSPYQVSSPMPPPQDQQRYRRAESMFNLSESALPAGTRQRSVSLSRDEQPQQSYDNNYNYNSAAADDWARYASDLGSSENITRPFAREVQICYQRQRPQGIRAPRLTASTNDLYGNNTTSNYDMHHAYGSRRTHAPMLGPPPQRSHPQYASCYSVLQRDPNPTYISTTSRRGVSPAPPPYTAHTTTAPPANFNEPQAPVLQQRRASLPREIHEQQLKYITSKEEELKTEFERLQNERLRLIAELQQTPPVVPQPPAPQRPMRESYRQTAPRLPTLSEDEVFRQQMAEEWLSKVAEREERRLHKIIKISKSHEEDLHAAAAAAHPDISEEFLNRVRERRHKLAMPSDSDWESGAESQPVRAAAGDIIAAGQSSDAEELSAVKVLEGKSEADLKHLPKHLREFARFSNHQREQLENGTGQREVHEEEERRHEVSDNASSRAVKKSSFVKMVKISQPQTEAVTAPSTVGQDSVESSADDSPSDAWPHMTNSDDTVLPPVTPLSARLPPTPDEWFAHSPFRQRIHEEFTNFWRHFENGTT